MASKTIHDFAFYMIGITSATNMLVVLGFGIEMHTPTKITPLSQRIAFCIYTCLVLEVTFNYVYNIIYYIRYKVENQHYVADWKILVVYILVVGEINLSYFIVTSSLSTIT